MSAALIGAWLLDMVVSCCVLHGRSVRNQKPGSMWQKASHYLHQNQVSAPQGAEAGLLGQFLAFVTVL